MARLLLLLLLAALCWAGEAADVCDFTEETGSITLCSQQAMDRPIKFLPRRIRQIKIPSSMVSGRLVKYHITDIHFEGATNLMVKDASYTKPKKQLRGFKGIIESKEIVVKLEWPSIKLVMNVSSTKLCSGTGPCRQVTVRPTLRFKVATLDKTLPAGIFQRRTGNGCKVIIFPSRANVRLEIGDNPITDNIQVNSSPDSDKGLADGVGSAVGEIWQQLKSNITGQLRRKMDDWFVFNFESALARKLKA